jgi:hypothetical protein
MGNGETRVGVGGQLHWVQPPVVRSRGIITAFLSHAANKASG